MIKKIYTMIAVLCFTASVFAQAPQKMSYQAVIRNSSDALVTSTPVGMRISIIQDSMMGSAIYVETQTTSTNANGLVSLDIGTGTVITGTFAGINWATGPYFIKTETDLLGGTAYTISGTNELMSVPYALYAANCDDNWKDTTYVYSGMSYDLLQSKRPTIVITNNVNNSGTNIGSDGIELASPHPILDFKNSFNDDANMRIAYDSTGINRLTISTLDPLSSWKWDQYVFSENGNFGINNSGIGFNPKSRVHVNNGDVYIDNPSNGVIMKSPDGTCWRLTVNNAGIPAYTRVTCP